MWDRSHVSAHGGMSVDEQQRRWAVIVARVLCGGGAILSLVWAFFALAFAGCHDSGGFCSGDKTASEAREWAGTAAFFVAFAGVLISVALWLPRRRWVVAGVVTAVLATAAGVVAYTA